MIDAVPALDVERIDASEEFDVLQFPQAGHGWSLIINVERAPTDELAVRQAMAYAIDYESMQDIVFEGLGTRACSPLTDVMFAWTDAYCQAYSYSPEEAGRILDEAGWVMNDATGIRERDGVPLVIQHFSPERPLAVSTGQFLQEDFAAVGIDFQLNFSDVAAYLEVVRAGNHNSQQWWDTQTDPDGVFRTLYHSSNADGGTNRSRYRSEAMDALIDQAVGIANQDERAAVYAQIQQTIVDEALTMFLNDPTVLFASTPQVQGVTILGGGFIPNFYAASMSG
jgi:ABC-type transport system substrate-binding protein